jgi:glycosyltransferase involved in cell wall biosynthesis
VVLGGQGGDFPGSAHVRMLRRLHHPAVRSKLQATVHHGSELTALAPGSDVVIAQRTALPPERIDWFLEEIDRCALPLVLDLDDDLFALGAEHPEYGEALDGVARLLAAANLVTVSTPALAAVLAGRGVTSLVIPNAIDERLFFAHQPAPTPPPRGPGEPMRAVYVSGPGHEDDLALLAPVFERLAVERVPVALDVVSRPLAGPAPSWYRSIPVPSGHGGYPTFVRWLKRERPGWDLAVAPLCNTPFNRAKSDLKFLEYAALGLPGIYSRSVPYDSVTPEVTGLVVDDDPGSWCEAIVTLAADPALRSRLAAAALAEVREHRLLAGGDDRLVAVLFDLVAGDEGVRRPLPPSPALVAGH